MNMLDKSGSCAITSLFVGKYIPFIESYIKL